MYAFCDGSRRLHIAKKIEISAAHNIRANLRYYFKKYKQNFIGEKIVEISDLIKKFSAAKSINELLITEAKIREIYYSCFNCILDDDGFDFDKRTKHPPQSAINAMISFGNSLLYQNISTKIRKSTLDIKIGFIHSPNRRRETLQFDLSEIFKPIIVDRVIFSLINKHIISETSHFEFENQAVYLNKTGKYIFIDAFERKLHDRIVIDGSSITYDELIKSEISELIRHINGEAQYSPYKYY